jgi:tRNA (guanine37-N1)-methyltransferase
MLFTVLTIFPDLLRSPLDEGIIRKAQADGKIRIEINNIRDFAEDKHSMTDDRPFGGGEGMVMKPEPLTAAVKEVHASHPGKKRVILLSPQGKLYNQAVAQRLSLEKHLVLVCGRYEGVDERFRSAYVDEEISIGDYILTGGELAAMAVIDSVTRLIPGVLGCSDSADKDSFSRGLLKHPQFTRPRTFEEQEVPVELLSGDHKKIEQYRFLASVRRTLSRRPDLIKSSSFNDTEMKLLRKHGLDKDISALKKSAGLL